MEVEVCFFFASRVFVFNRDAEHREKSIHTLKSQDFHVFRLHRGIDAVAIAHSHTYEIESIANAHENRDSLLNK